MFTASRYRHVSNPAGDSRMSLPREQLIADWRTALAAAERQPLGTSRPFWLARMRVRLYRFLLSLYGDGQWNTDSPVSAPEEPNPLTIDPPEAFPFHGKPAKGEGKIRSVLKSVASAQGPPPAAGPHVAGIGAESWVIVAAESANLDPVRTVLMLHGLKVIARVVHRGDDVTVEVPARQLKDALRLVELHRRRLRRRARPQEIRRVVCTVTSQTVSTFQLWLSFTPLCAIAAVFSAVNTYPDAGDRGDVPQLVSHGIAVFVLLSLLVLYRPVAKLVNRLALACEARLHRRTPATMS